MIKNIRINLSAVKDKKTLFEAMYRDATGIQKVETENVEKEISYNWDALSDDLACFNLGRIPNINLVFTDWQNFKSHNTELATELVDILLNLTDKVQRVDKYNFTFQVIL
jgi:Barstar (barnase inhibitor)